MHVPGKWPAAAEIGIPVKVVALRQMDVDATDQFTIVPFNQRCSIQPFPTPAHNNHFPRRPLRGLATAGGERASLGKAVDTPSPPCRSAPGASGNGKRYLQLNSQRNFR
jgi:hypothetical protein